MTLQGLGKLALQPCRFYGSLTDAIEACIAVRPRASHNAYRPFCDRATGRLQGFSRRIRIEQFEHGDEVRAFAEEISRANKLPLTTRYELR